MIDWNSHSNEVIVVISDLHSNKRAIKAALDLVKQKRTDKLIILGDILSYGIDVSETMEMIQRELDNGAELIAGNHDEIYLDMIAHRSNILTHLYPELQESIIYNLNRINYKQFYNWSWKKEITYNNIYFSHANPYGNTWEYIKNKEEFKIAATKIRDMKYLAGVFGHTHRAAHFGLLNGFLPNIEGLDNDIWIINPGSVGQPRSDLKSATILRLSAHDNRLWSEVEEVTYDIQAHIYDIQNSELSSTAKSKFISFFKGTI